MPDLIPTPCHAFGCGNITTERYCDKHAHLKRSVRRRNRAYDRHRPNAYQRGYDRHWDKARRLFLKDNPLCARCAELGLVVQADVVDHIEPHRGDKARFWNRSNWQALCKRCHDKKTGAEKGDSWY